MKIKLTMAIYVFMSPEMTIESKLLNQFSMILVSFFSEDIKCFCLMKSKYATFFNIKVTKIERSAFLGHPI